MNISSKINNNEVKIADILTIKLSNYMPEGKKILDNKGILMVDLDKKEDDGMDADAMNNILNKNNYNIVFLKIHVST